MAKYYKTPIKAIRDKCLDCSCFQLREVRKCPIIECPIYPYRFGKRPSNEIKKTLKEHFDKKA